MKKMKTVFIINYDGLGNAKLTENVRPENKWVLNGEGKATIKFDGTAAMIKDGVLFKRWDRKLTKKFSKQAKRLGSKFKFNESMLKEVPKGAIPCQPNPDPVTFHHPHWVKVEEGKPEDKYFLEALSNLEKIEDGTFEMVGEKVQGNLYNLTGHHLWKHGSKEVNDIELTFEGIKKWLEDNQQEGLVFHHPDGRMSKIRRKDMFKLKNGNWYDGIEH